VGYTIAEGVAVGNPGVKGERVLDALRATDGVAEIVTDEEIVGAMRALARAEGVWSGPTGAASLAVLDKLAKAGQVDASATVVCLVSETGLKGDFPPFPAAPVTLNTDMVRRVLAE
jgi:threonine synthase